MKLGSILKISIHNIMQNKTRSLLTIIVLFVMATVLMLMAAFGVSFYQSADASVQKQFQTSETQFILTYMNSENDTAPDTIEMPVSVVQSTLDIMNGSNSLFTKIYLKGYAQNLKIKKDDQNVVAVNGIVPYYAKSNMFFGSDNYLYEGRMWNASDDNSTNIWLSSYYTNYYKLGEEVTLSFDATQKFKICGFFNYSQWAGQDNGTLFIDYHYCNGTKAQSKDTTSDSPVLYVESITGEMIPQESFNYGLKTQNRFKDLNEQLYTYTKGSKGIVVECELLSLLETSRNILLGVLGIVAFLGMIIIMLSIGSVANAIKITVEQNRKFFGMMKAIGMKDRTVKDIVQWQAALMILVSVVLSTAVVMGLILALKSVLTSLVGMMFGANAVIACTVSPIIPIVTFVALIFSVLISANASLNDISKMDVISVISEVS